jgi:UDP-N-acetylmuramoyl-L-alanyl-D-glutamate--2,6-diaminopimelate ligase
VVPGRVELVADTFPRVFVDYAHKPDALEKMLAFLKPLCQRGEKVGRLINVFGCGGERDTGKRPLMGGIAARLADVNIITSDNPRTEDPLLIIDQIRAGIPESNSSEVIVEPNRRQAIYRAIQMAQPEDLVVIAGKGHEPYQEIQGIKYPFNDIHVAREAIASRS